MIMATHRQIGSHETYLEAWSYFFQVITHPAILDSLSMSTFLENIYSFMSGCDGGHAIFFFRHACESLVETRACLNHTFSKNQVDKALDALCQATMRLFEQEVDARQHEKADTLITSLVVASEAMTEPDSIALADKMFCMAKEIRSLNAHTQGMLLRGEYRHDLEGSHRRTTSIHVHGQRLRMPGGRHDNDNTDIGKVAIFPTRQEILCEVQDFLPFADPDQPHHLVRKEEEHIDSQFRLLRHDIFGQIKGIIRPLLASSDLRSESNYGKLSIPAQHGAPTVSYPGTFVSNIDIKGRGGLQIQLSVEQPEQIPGKLWAEGKGWWSDSQRFEEGTLMSFLFESETGNDHLFLVAADIKTTHTSVTSEHRESEARVVVGARLSTNDQHSINAVLNLYSKKTFGLLLEHTNTLPATFVPVLTSLQSMQKLSRLPFAEWILPESTKDDTGTFRPIPSPRYTLKSGFEFSLQSILLPGASSFSVPSGSSISDQHINELSMKTGLDVGQSQALLAALTRKFALIQGPPGTGKTYVGIKLLMVLLTAKISADLGPIVVV